MNKPAASTAVRSGVTLAHYTILATIRAVEKLLLESFGTGLLRGTTHTYLGQEAIAVAALSQKAEGDIVLSNHRSHGHFIAYGGDYRALLDEIAGLPEGVCKGLGGSQHLQWKDFYSNGVLGGTIPVATGMALAEKLKGTKAVGICFLGDGALGEGVAYESFNMASLWQAPIVYVVENNRFAQSTPVELNLAGSIKKRFEAFGIETDELESNDLGELLPVFEKAFADVRARRKPRCVVVHTYRMGPHSKGDDVRSKEELRVWEAKDPLLLAERRLDAAECAAARARVETEVSAALESTLSRARAAASAPVMPAQDDALIPAGEFGPAWVESASGTMMVGHLNAVLHGLFERDERVLLIGEDLLDPYGGAFKVSKGLSTKFPKRVFSSPISEAGIAGLANGMALRGLRPVVEIMFGDFSTLILDQLLNHAVKFSRMYGGKVRCPVIVRAPMGGYRGYGPTHSQSVEKIFLGVPGLTVVACDPLRDQAEIWKRMVALDQPVLYVENKTLYGQGLKPHAAGKVDGFFARASGSCFPTAELQLSDFAAAPSAVLLAYGGMVPLALAAARSLFVEDELVVKVVVPSQLAPVPEKDLLAAVGACRAVVTLEEGTRRAGWGAELAALLAEKLSERVSLRRVGALDTVIPSSKEGESLMLPSESAVAAAVREAVDGL